MGLASSNFINMFSPMKVFHLARFGSDHTVIRIDLEAPEVERRNNKIHVFRFEEAWTKDSR